MKIQRKNPNGVELRCGMEAFREDLGTTDALLRKLENLVAIFGGSGILAGSEYYRQASRMAERLAGAGISVITGGGPGIMEAANRGALEAASGDAKSYGLKVTAIKEEIVSEEDSYLSEDCGFTYNTLSVRLLTLISSSDVVVFCPGGYGTFEELFCLLVRIKVNMMREIPIYLIGTDFWKGLVDWLKTTVVQTGTIEARHVDLLRVEDDVEKVASEIIEYISEKK